MKYLSIIFLVLFSLSNAAEIIESTVIDTNSYEDLPDENSTKLNLSDYYDDNRTINRMNFESNVSMETVLDKEGDSALVITEVTKYYTLNIPKACFEDYNSSLNLTASTLEMMNINFGGYASITDKNLIRIALGLEDSDGSSVLLKKNISMTENTKCIKVFTDVFSEGKYVCGKCVNYFKPSLVTLENNSTYVPNNQALKNYFQFDPKENKGIDLIQKMFNNSALSRDTNVNNLLDIDPDSIPEDLMDTKEAEIQIKTKNLVDKMFLTQIRQSVVRCFAKRKLVPRFYCPIPGFEFGAQTGGTPEDDLRIAKEECDSYCASAPYPCKSYPTGHSIQDTFTNVAIFNFDANASLKVLSVELDVNTDLELKDIKYDLFMNYRDVNLTELVGVDANITDADIKINIKIEYSNGEGNYTSLTGSTPNILESTINKMKIPQTPKTDKIKITFFKPYLVHKDIFIDVNIDELVSSISAENFKINYTGNSYHFCSFHQIIQDASTQCSTGRTFEINNGSETFLICESDSRPRGTEEKYGGYYTEQSCEDNCRNTQECVETYSHYTEDISSPEAYKITVGCVDDPYNVNCSQEICEAKFRDHEDMPIEEIVYDSRNGTSNTVISGVQVEGKTRPKIMIDDELNAVTSEDYEQLFLDETKDEAYKNMIHGGSFQYTKKPISESQPFEYAYREEGDVNTNIDFYIASPLAQKIYWKLKPASHDIKNGKKYFLYKVAVTEQMFQPISGTFIEDNDRLTTPPKRAYKDIVFSYITDTGNIPFYIKEYEEVFVDGNESAGEVSGWVTNTQNRKNKYIAYDFFSETYVPSSKNVSGSHYRHLSFEGNKNYEEYLYLENKHDYFLQSGASIQSQSSSNNLGSLPIKIYEPSKNVSGEDSSIVNYHFYGVYSDVQLSNEDIINIVDTDEKDKYLIYRATKGTNNKEVIYGDGTIYNEKFKIFLKGPANLSTLSVEIEPKIEEESKDVVMFMFLFEGDI